MSTARSRLGLGVWALVVALVALVVLTFLPTPYVIQRPGPVYDTLGTALDEDEQEVPLIEIDGAETHETDGALKLTTVQVVGNRERTPSWFELALAWTDRSRAVVPIEQVFPAGVTTKERDERNAVLMVDSQHEATAAALTQLGYDTNATVTVVEAIEGSPADGLLQEGDVILAADEAPMVSGKLLREAVQTAAGKPLTLTVLRDGETLEIPLTAEQSETDGTWLIGISLITEYDFPIDVRIQLEHVGGPSAGLMFALGIIDRLTPGQLTGGDDIAGTGTIEADGTVGPIGGIRQKLYGASESGADYFLAPLENCAEVVGHVPDDLQVVATATLEDSLAALEVIAADGDVSALPSCQTAVE